MSHNEPFNDCQQIRYRTLMVRLADLVGRHQLPVNTEADDINEFLDGDPVHYELIRDIVRSIYRSGRCSHLDSEVRAETVFNSLGDIRGQLLADRDTDIDQINLLEELGWASRVLFAAPAPRREDPGTSPDGGADEQDDEPVVLPHPFL